MSGSFKKGRVDVSSNLTIDALGKPARGGGQGALHKLKAGVCPSPSRSCQTKQCAAPSAWRTRAHRLPQLQPATLGIDWQVAHMACCLTKVQQPLPSSSTPLVAVSVFSGSSVPIQLVLIVLSSLMVVSVKGLISGVPYAPIFPLKVYLLKDYKQKASLFLPSYRWHSL